MREGAVVLCLQRVKRRTRLERDALELFRMLLEQEIRRVGREAVVGADVDQIV